MNIYQTKIVLLMLNWKQEQYEKKNDESTSTSFHLGGKDSIDYILTK